MNYTHLSQKQRYEIAILKRQGYSNTKIAEILGVHRSTIGRELHRNGRKGRYGGKKAHQRSAARRQQASQQPRKMTPELIGCIEQLLRCEQWSPQQISDRLKREGCASVSHEWIYQHVYADQRRGGDLHRHLRGGRKKRKRRLGRPSRRGQLRNRVMIDQRPAMVDRRERNGDFELDTIIGVAHQGALVTIVDRRTLYTYVRRVSATTAEEVRLSIIDALGAIRTQVQTLTADNGREFAQHEQIAQSLTCEFYFAHPYHSWERGSNENTNGLIRQYFPKKTNFLLVTDEQVAEVERKLNNRPRRVLGGATPTEAWFNRFDCLVPHQFF